MRKYLSVISSYEREFKPWETRVEKILKRYRDEKRDNKDRLAKFNILWSNVQTLVPATFSKLPKPDVSRRFRDQDQTGRVAALILERALDFEVQHYTDYRSSMKQVVYDRFLGGRGTCWARYEPHFKAIQKGEPGSGAQITEDVDATAVDEQLDYECAPIDYVHWKDFGHSIARTWEEVTVVYRVVYMGEKAVNERFGKKVAKKIPYDATPDELKRASRDGSDIKKQAKIYEIWDKEEGCAYWLHKSMPDFLDEREDPLGLQEFFPCPKPLYATLTNESLIPVPDFTLYQDQANSLDTLADRIVGLIEMLQVKGVYDGSADAALGRLFTEGTNGKLLPVKNWAAFAEKNGLQGQIDVLDLTMVAKALDTAILAFSQSKEEVYEITGISDIIRGQTAASETATAQQIKGQYASLRLRSMQDDVARFATDCLQLKAQIMCCKFNPQTLAAIAAAEQLQEADKPAVYTMLPGQPDPQTGQPGQPQPMMGHDGKPIANGPAMVLLVGKERLQDPASESPNPMRSFRVEVAADTLVQLDESKEKADRMELLTVFGGYLEKAAQVGAMAPQTLPIIVEVGKFVISTFKAGKQIEGAFDQALEQLKAQAAKPQPEKPDPAMVKVEAEKQKMAAEMAMDRERFEMEKAKAQEEIARDREKFAAEMQIERERFEAEKQRENEKALREHSMRLDESERAHTLAREDMAVNHEIARAAARDKTAQARRPQ